MMFVEHTGKPEVAAAAAKVATYLIGCFPPAGMYPERRDYIKAFHKHRLPDRFYLKLAELVDANEKQKVMVSIVRIFAHKSLSD